MPFFSQPTCLDDFALKQIARTRLEHILLGIRQIPSIGVNGILLWGPFGSGKTTMANLLPDLIEFAKTQPQLSLLAVGKCTGRPVSNHNVLFNPCAQGQNGVQLIDRIDKFTWTYPLESLSGFKFVILDEFDLLTPAAQASFKSLMTSAININVIFIMTTNHLNMIDPGVANRSITIDMSAAPPTSWQEKLQGDFDKNNEHFDWNTWAPLVEAGNGSCRSILSDIETALALRNLTKVKPSVAQTSAPFCG